MGWQSHSPHARHEISASNHLKGSYDINLNSSATAKFQFGPNLIKIFATGKEAFRPDIYTRTILAVRDTA